MAGRKATVANSITPPSPHFGDINSTHLAHTATVNVTGEVFSNTKYYVAVVQSLSTLIKKSLQS